MDAGAVTPRQRAASLSRNGIATERSKQHHTARLLCRSNEQLLASRAFAAWAAATRERRLQAHMHRCSTMMKRTTTRQDYSRFFLRWLAFTQTRTFASYRSELQVRKDVPLRSKADFLALARRYFAKWRTHLREKRQRSSANVDLLAALNRERLRSRTLLRWWRFYHVNTTRRHDVEVREHVDTIRRLQSEVRRAVNEAEALRDRLTASLQTQARLQEELDASRDSFNGSQHRQQAEIGELRAAMRTVMEMMEGSGGPHLRTLRKWGSAAPSFSASPVRKSNPLTNAVDAGVDVHSRSPTPDVSLPPPTLAATVAESPLSSAQQSKDTQAALQRCVEDALAALADLSQTTTAPISLEEAIEGVRRRLEDDAEELAAVQGQRDELAAAARAARLAFASTSPSLAATANSIVEAELDISRAASVASSRLGGTLGGASNTSAVRGSHRVERSVPNSSHPNNSNSNNNNISNTSASRRTGAAAAIINGSLPNTYLPSGASTPTVSVPNSPGESPFTDSHDLPRLLVADAKNVVNTVAALRKSERQAKAEVTDLQDAAVRAIDALGGSGVASDDFVASPEESAEARARRSGAIAMGLRNLCEDMIVVLVLTSLWSGKRASERVSEALERLWHRTQDLEATHAGYLHQLDNLIKVVHVAARMLVVRQQQPSPISNTTTPASTPRNVATPRRASAALARRRHTVVADDEESPLSPDEVEDARRCAEDWAAKGDSRPADLLRRCEEAAQRAATQSTVLTSELEGLLQSSQDLLAATVGVERDAATTTTPMMTPRSARGAGTSAAAAAAANELSMSSRASLNETSMASTAAPTPSPQEVVAALRAAARKVARVVTKVGESADTPLMVATQDVLAQLEQAKKAQADLEKQLRAAETQMAAAETQHGREKTRSEATEQKLRQQLEALGEQQKHGEAVRKQLEARIKEAESQARLTERSHKKELDDLAKAQKAAEKELQQQMKALEREMEQQTQEKRRNEKEIKALQAETKEAEKALQKTQEILEKEKAAHVRTQEALDAQLKASMSNDEASTVAMAKLQEQLHALQEECHHAEEEKAQLQDGLHEERDAREQALRACEEQRETVAAERQLHAEELEKAQEAQQAVEEENQRLTAEVEALEQKLHAAEAQQSSSSAKEEELQARVRELTAENDARDSTIAELHEDLEALQLECHAAQNQTAELKDTLQQKASEHAEAKRALEQQLRALEEAAEQQAQEKQRSEKEIKALQEENQKTAIALQEIQDALDKEKAAHARTQEALDAQLKASMSNDEAFTVAMTKLQEQLHALQEECHHAEEEKAQLQDGLHEERDAREQALKACEEQRETVAAERQLHAEELEKAQEAQQAVEEENQRLTAEIEALGQKLHEELEKQHTESDAARQDLEDQLAAAKAASEADAAVRAHLEQQLLYVEGENRVNNAVGVFLRDVLRDCLTRLHQLTRSLGDAEPLSPRASLTLQHASNAPPPLLTHDSDPSDYVEYILRLDGNDSTGKRLVQEHLRENSAVHGMKLPLTMSEEDGTSAATTPDAAAARGGDAAGSPGSAAGAAGAASVAETSDPSTWEVVAELHDRFVLLYERFAQLDQVAADQLALNGALSSEKEQLCADALMSLQQLQPWSSAAAHATATVRTANAGPSRSSSPTAPLATSDTTPQHPSDQTNTAATTVSDAAPTTTAGALQADVAGPALRGASAEVAQALAALQLVADAVRPLVQLRSPQSASRRASVSAYSSSGARAEVAATEHLQALVADVQDMADCLQHLSKSVHHGIIALGGAASDEEEDADGGSGGADGEGPRRANNTLPGQSPSGGAGGHGNANATGKDGMKQDSRSLAARLEAICEETGTSILEVKHLLLGGEAAAPQSPAKPLKLGDVIPQIRAKMAELEDVKRESARLLNGLNRAFNDDDEESLFAASMSSTHSRSLKPKKKPLPAFQGTPEAGLRLLQQEIKGKKGRRTGAPPDAVTAMGSFGSHIRDRLGDLQNLRLVCRNTLQVLEGRASTEEEGGQPPSYGEALVTLLTTQVEDLKQALVESEEALKGYRSDLRNVTVGTRLHLLADVVNSLKLERDSLKEDINRRGRQSNMLLDDLNREAKALRAELAAHREANTQLANEHDDVSEELEAQKRNAAELAARLAQIQHESNVLSTALASALRGLPASSFSTEAPAAVEKNLQAALKVDQGDALTHAVDEALTAAAQHQQQLRNTFHTRLAALKDDLAGLRSLVARSWADYGAPMAEAAAQLVTETAEVLTLENDMLRPRAVERERLKTEVATLQSALDDATATRDDAVDRLQHLDEENVRLRRALRDAEMAQVLRGGDGGDITTFPSPAQLLDSRAVDWERRMIAGATDLAMDAIDSMSGRPLSAVFGAVAEETLRVYKAVRETLQTVAAACAAARGTDGRRLWAEVDACLDDLDTLSASADFLRTRLPVLYRASYQ